MRRTLLITNDFPPRTGGIQSYVYELARRLPPSELVVYAPSWPGAAEFDAAQAFPVHRHPTSLMVPSPLVRSTAIDLVTRHQATAVWYGAAAPLALLTPALRRHGVIQSVACTHGHEVGWSMLPIARGLLGRIGRTNDVMTFISHYSRRRIAAALGAGAALEYLPPGVDTAVFRPDDAARSAIRARHGLTDSPVVVCISRLVPRKGQDALIEAWPTVLQQVPAARLLIVGGGSYQAKLGAAIDRLKLTDQVILTGPVPSGDLPGYYAAGDVFAMPCRTRGGGLDVEGLGIVFLEASATGLPVIAGNSGGATEAVIDGGTGEVIDGRDRSAIAAACVRLLHDTDLARRYGHRGRDWVADRWTWDSAAARLAALLSR